MLQVGLFTEVYHPVVNGVVTAVDSLAQSLDSLGHQATIFTPRHSEARRSGNGVVRIPSLPLPMQTEYRLTLPMLPRGEVLRHVRRLDILHLHSPFVTGWMGLRYAKRYGRPTVYSYHTQLEEYAHYVPFEPHATRYAASELTRRFANAVDAVIVPTPAMERRLRELGVEARIEIIPSGIDVARFAAGRRSEARRQEMGAGAQERLLLVVGRLAREKNLGLLLEALATIDDPQVHLAILGDGPERDSLEALRTELRLEGRVRFLGSIERDLLPDYYASADAFVFPSTTETQGLVQVEALAAALPIIAVDSLQNREVLADCAHFVRPNPRSFAEAMARPHLQTTSALEMRGVAGRYDSSALTRRVLEVYEEAMAALATPA